MNILLSAYSCHPTDGSEPAIGWNWATCIATNGHNVVVMTRGLNRARIESDLGGQPPPGVRFEYHDLPRVWHLLYKLPLGNYLYYVLWQRTAANRARGLHREESFDLAHHITWGSFRVPSWMGRLGIPFTFGPVGGGEDTPRRLRAGLGWRGRLWDALRRVSSALMAPWMAPTYDSATQIVTTTRETRDALPARFRNRAVCRPAVGIDADLVRRRTHASRPVRLSSRLELLFVGRLLPWKGVHLIVKALAELRGAEHDVHLTVVGSGRDRRRLEGLSRQLGVERMISWKGWLPRDTVIGLYSQFDLFTFPSLHDSGGMAVLEAMSFGLPVLCLDLGGPAMAVDGSCGHVIDTRDRDEAEVVAAIREFLCEVLEGRTALASLACGARARAESLTWQANVDAVYRQFPATPAPAAEGACCAEV